MKLSIITVNLNNRDGLKKTIDSVICQTSKDFEWIIIDGGSTDGSVELIKKYAEFVIYWVSEPDNGIFNAMNKGIKKACGDYLLFLNSGDCLAENDIIDYLNNCTLNDDFIVGKTCSSKDSLPPIKQKDNYTTEETLERLSVSAFPHQATFVRRNVFQKYGLYREDKQLASDWYLTICALIKGNSNVSYIPQIVSYIEPNGISQRNQNQLFRERKDLLDENPLFFILFDFYTSNKDIIKALKSNCALFFLFRVTFFFYRKLFQKPI